MPRKTRFIVAFSIALAAVAALFLQPSPGVDATGFRPGVTYRTCDNASASAFPTFSCNLNIAPSTTLDSVTGFDIAPPDANFSSVVAYTSSTYYSTAIDTAIPNGAIVGELHSLATLGLVNGGCFTQLLVDFTFVDATTDFLTAGAVDPAKIITPAGPADNRLLNLAQDDGDWDNDGVVDHPASANNGIPDGADGYPSYVATALDPDGAGPTLPLQPRARYLGVAVVPKAASGTIVILQFTVMEPGTLRALVGYGGASASLGYGSLTFLQDPTEAPTNGAITDFCTPLATTTALHGTTRDNACTPAPGGGDCAFNVTAGGLTNTVNLIVESPNCPGGTTPDECGSTRFASLAVPPGGVTAQYTVQSQSLRGTDDGDGIENNLDPCPLGNDSTWDPRAAQPAGGPGDVDGDGLPSSCDPNDAVFNDDQDGDGWQNRGDNCPLIPNGDTTSTMFEAVGSTAINVTSTNGFPSSPGFQIDIDSANIRERRTVSSISPGTPGIFNISVGVSTSHLAGVPVVQIFRSNVNSGQSDFDIPYPGVVPEGPRTDFIGPECDTGSVGTDVLSPTSAQGHYHRTASIARLCITSNPAADDLDGDGVCNAQDPNSASTDSDGDATARGEPERIYTSANAVVDAGDTRRTANATGLAVGDAGGSVVACPVGTDCGDALANFAANEKYTDDEPGTASRYDVNECVYRDNDSNNSVTNGDTRLHVDVADVPIFGPPHATPNCNLAGGSTVVCPGNSDCGTVTGLALVAFDADEKHIDSRVPSVGLTATDYRNPFQTCTNRITDDSDTDIDFADTDCLGAHFDRFDNCMSVPNTAPAGFSQTDTDWDGIGDACDPLVDGDNSPSSDSLERHIGTGIDTACSRTGGATGANDETIDAQAEDTNDDRSITAADLSAVAGVIGKFVPPAPVRLDIFPEPAGDNSITAGDLSKVAAIIGFACGSQNPPL